MRLDYPATTRNRDVITAVLHAVLGPTGHLLEIASGSGQHTAHFAAAFPNWTFQPTDMGDEQLASISSWSAERSNVSSPLHLDVLQPWPVHSSDVIFCANMIHIAPWECALALLRGAGECLPTGGHLILYGPFLRSDYPTAPSNLRFDASLRARDPSWGIRDLDEVRRQAATHQLRQERVVEMPANNLTVVFEKE